MLRDRSTVASGSSTVICIIHQPRGKRNGTRRGRVVVDGDTKEIRDERREERSRFPGGISPALLLPPPRHSVIFYWVYDVINLIASSSHQGLIATYLKAVDTLSRVYLAPSSSEFSVSLPADFEPDICSRIRKLSLGISAFSALLPFRAKRTWRFSLNFLSFRLPRDNEKSLTAREIFLNFLP